MNEKYKFHPKYIPPSELTIKEKIKELGTRVDPQQVRDFMATYSWQVYEQDIEQAFVDKKDISWHISNRLSSQDIEKERLRLEDVLAQERKFLKKFPYDALPGEDNLLKSIAASYLYTKLCSRGSMPTVKSMREYINNLRQVVEMGVQGTFGLTGDLYKDLCKADKKTLDILEHISLLDILPATSTKIASRRKEDPSGDNISYLPMLEYVESTQGNLIEKVLPNYKRKLAQKDVFVKKRVSYEDRSQTVAVLIDNSSSMENQHKISWIHAILFNRFKAVKQGDITLYVSSFIQEVDGFEKITPEHDVEKFIRRNYAFNGGGTDIASCVEETIAMIKSKELLGKSGTIQIEGEEPEILVINDGDDHIDDSYHPDIKLNTFCLFRENTNLKNICHRSGGTYMTVGN